MEQNKNIPVQGKDCADAPDTLAGAFEAPRQEYTSLEFPRKTEPRPGRRHLYVYDVVFDGETIVTGSPDPEPDLARALLARGITGTITVFEGKKPRTIVNIEGAAKIRTSEPCDRRSRFVRHAEAGHGRPCHL